MSQSRNVGDGRVGLGRSLTRRFAVEARLGCGGLGELYRVRVVGSDDRLALRWTKIADAPVVLDTIGRVVALHTRLADLPLVRVRDCGGDEGRMWYAMDYSDGEALLTIVRRLGPVAADRAVAVVLDASATVMRLHAHGVVHQTLNARNLFIEGDRVLLAEIGIMPELARVYREKPALFTTPRMRAPEQWVSPEPDPRTDVYALGAVLYYLLTGRKVLPEGGVALRLATDGGVRPPRFDAVPERLRPLMQRALAMRPDERFASAKEWIDALRMVSRS